MECHPSIDNGNTTDIYEFDDSYQPPICPRLSLILWPLNQAMRIMHTVIV